MTFKHLFWTIALGLLGVVSPLQASNKKKKNDKDLKIEQVQPKGSFRSTVNGYIHKPGMIDVYSKEGNYLFGIPRKLIGKDLLLTSRVSTISDNSGTVAGEMPHAPVLIEFSTQGDKLFIHKKSAKNICDPESSLKASFERNFVAPAWKSYKIKASNDSVLLVDMNNLFASDVKELSPFTTGSIKGAMSGSLVGDLSFVTGVKSFPQNLQVKSQLGYTVKGNPFMVTMTRNIILLPEIPMRPRYADPRIGYFDERKEFFSDKNDGVVPMAYIKRWNLQPKDAEAYARGEVVEVLKPIVFYIDTAIPAKWRPYIKEGVLAWNKAFEKIGYKNVIQVKDYPQDDPTFDPDDIRYNCYRMITTNVENSVGPSCSDPRTGEIIQADVLFYFNSVRLLHNWRFVQTAAVDPRTHKKVFDDELTGSSLRYVATHEIGHTLGLLHNFRASSTIPVDSLRSASFTQKYGTTPSIMDYARYNYIAQPEDKGVNLLPPPLGVYDEYAISWGYKPILSAITPEDELPTLNQWIREKEDNPMYLYGPQYFFGSVDPSCQSEDLGDDAVKAGEYGIKNLKYIMKHLPEWCVEEGKDYKRLETAYHEISEQLQRYMYHAVMYIGSIYMDETVSGDGRKSYYFIDRKTQERALQFVLKQIYDLPNWMSAKEVTDNIGLGLSVSGLQAKFLKSLFATPIATALAQFEQHEPARAYTYQAYMNDIYQTVWKKSLIGAAPNIYERQLQFVYMSSLIRALSSKGEKRLSPSERIGLTSVPCCDFAIGTQPEPYADAHHLFDFNSMEDMRMVKNPVLQAQAIKLKNLLNRLRQSTSNKVLRAHYEALYKDIKTALGDK